MNIFKYFLNLMESIVKQIQDLSLQEKKTLQRYFKQTNTTKLAELILKNYSYNKGKFDTDNEEEQDEQQIEELEPYSEEEHNVPHPSDQRQFDEMLLQPNFDPVNDTFFQNYLISYPDEIMNFLNLYLDELIDEYILPDNQRMFLSLFIDLMIDNNTVIPDDILFQIIDFFTNLQGYEDLYDYNEFIPILIEKVQNVNVYPEYIETICLLEPEFSIYILDLLMSKNFNINNVIQNTSILEMLIGLLRTATSTIFTNVYKFTNRYIQYPNLNTQSENIITTLINVIKYHVNIYTRSNRLISYSKIEKLIVLKNRLNIYGYNITTEEQELYRNTIRPYLLKNAQLARNTVYYNTLLQQSRARHIQPETPQIEQPIPTEAQDCTNTQDLFSLEDWTADNLPNIKIRIYKNTGLQDYTTFCGDRDTLVQYFNSQSLIVPWLRKNINVPIEPAGYRGAPSKNIDPEMNFKSLPNQIYLQNWQLFEKQEYNNFVAIPLEKILLGNSDGTIGISQLHGQAESKQLIYLLVPTNVDQIQFIKNYLAKLLEERNINLRQFEEEGSDIEHIRYIYLHHPYKTSDYNQQGNLIE